VKPSASATPRATVDLPAPAGPSIAITMRRWNIGLRLMQTWDLPELGVRPRHPEVLSSDGEGRVIALTLPAGERLQEHQVHERAWLLVISGAIEIAEPGGEPVAGGAGMLASFAPNERREVTATEDALLLLVLSPWPGEGHPSNRPV
jgi:quercetin dioxygenase-like cupin family protein